MTDPFRDASVAELARAEREAEAARLRAEEKALDDARAAEVRRRWESTRRAREGDGNRGRWVALGLVALLAVAFGAAALGVGGLQREKPPPETAKPIVVTVDPGELRSTDSVSVEKVRSVIDRRADDLAKCFDEGLASGALVAAKGPAKAFAFGWVIEPGGIVSSAAVPHAGEPTAAEACMLGRIRVWFFGSTTARVEVVDWRFERCALVGGECVHPKDER